MFSSKPIIMAAICALCLATDSTPRSLQPDVNSLKQANDRHLHSTLANSVHLDPRVYTRNCAFLDNKDWFRLKHTVLFMCGQVLAI